MINADSASAWLSLRQQAVAAFAFHDGGDGFVRQKFRQTAADGLDGTVEMGCCIVG